VNEETIRLFAISKLGWIKRNQRKLQNQDRETPREFIERESHYFFGKRYLLRIKQTNGAGYITIRGKTYIDLYVKNDASIEYKQSIVDDWYRSELKKVIPEIIQYWEKKLNVNVNDWRIKRMKTKWGSCNTEAKRIWLNLELAKKPIKCLEYIIVHEMVHLLERHHNKRFLAYMDYYLPKWKHLKDELNRAPVSHSDWKY
jgi:predicted metal-dependent hydrolase